MTEGNTNAETLFCDYYEQWISVYKEGAIREVTMKKYRAGSFPISNSPTWIA